MADNESRPRRGGSRTSATKSVLTVAPTADDECGLCGGPAEVRYEGCDWCARCVAAFLAGMRRRREAELRLPPAERRTA